MGDVVCIRPGCRFSTDAHDRRTMNVSIETLIAKAVDHTSCGITIADCSGPDSDLPLVYVNRAFEEMTGYPKAEILQRNCRFLQADDRDQDARATIRHAVETGTACTVVLRNYRKDGTPFLNELHMSPITNDEGAVTHFVGIQTDVTRRVEAEQNRDAALEKSAATNRDLNEFAYVVSHDLRAPLRAIASLTDWLEEDYEEKFDAEGKRILGMITQRVHRLSNLIKGVLDFSRAGRQLEDIAPLDLAVVVAQVMDSVQAPAHIEIAIDGELPVIQTEPTRMIHVFQSLITNAIECMDKDPGRIAVSCVRRDGAWEFTVSDNGPGIDEKHHDKIFGLFQTLHVGEQLERAGVGLAISKKFIEGHGGAIWVASAPGAGSAFHFTWLDRESIAATEEQTA